MSGFAFAAWKVEWTGMAMSGGGLNEQSRRYFLSQCRMGLGALALSQLLGRDAVAGTNPLAMREPHASGKIKQVIFLFMAGGPSQLELFSDKPVLREMHGQAPPKSLLEGKRFAFLKGNEKLLGSKQKFARHGECGMEFSDLVPYHAQIADKAVWLRAMSTDVFNHGPAKLFLNTGFQVPGRASLGSWVTYALGSPSENLPGFVVLQSGPRGPRAGSTLWSSGYLPTSYQGVPFRNQGDPILALRNPPGYDAPAQREFFDAVRALNEQHLGKMADPEIETRINAYEMASRMQFSAPELTDLREETAETMRLYGAEPGKPSFATNCLLARRLVERGVRFVQLYHTDWDHHGGKGADLEDSLVQLCRETDQASAGLILDLERRGLLDETLVIWGGEFGRTPLGEERATIGRDHHVDGYTMWMAGGGLKRGYVHGETDDIGFGATEGKVQVRDLHATILHLLGLDHERLTYKFQGLDARLTGVEPAHVVGEILA
nr:DUF1501 domain-containing protein [Planctomyces sp. SH-PL14]